MPHSIRIHYQSAEYLNEALDPSDPRAYVYIMILSDNGEMRFSVASELEVLVDIPLLPSEAAWAVAVALGHTADELELDHPHSHEAPPTPPPAEVPATPLRRLTERQHPAATGNWPRSVPAATGAP